MKTKSKAAQIWIETVIYTLIGIAVIGILLAAAKPKLDSMKDKLVVEQTIESMNKMNEKIYEVAGNGIANKRIIDLKILKGRFIIQPLEDKILWTLPSKYRYSEPGKNISVGNLKILTKEGSPYIIEIWAEYSGEMNITSSSSENPKELDAAPSPYSVSIENKGNLNGQIWIDLVAK